MSRNWLLQSLAMTLVIGCLSAIPVSVQAAPQDKDAKKQANELATIRGSLVLESSIISEVDWDTIQGTLGQLVALEQPKLPGSWKEMDRQERQEWTTRFYETEAGKKLVAANQKALADRHLQEFRIRSKGKFIIYDVPRGRFEMRIVGQKVVGEKTYVLQTYGQFDVGEVDELDFSGMNLDVLRLLKMGEEAPAISGESSDGKKLSLAGLRGKHVLMAFGLTRNPAFQVTTASLKQVAAADELADKVQLLTVTVDEDVKAVAEFNKQQGVDWQCLNLGKWDQETLNNYGLKSVPSLWLIDPEGKIILTGQQFVFELNRTKFSVAKLIDETISGRLTIGGEKEDGPTPTKAGEPKQRTDGQSGDKAPGSRSR